FHSFFGGGVDRLAPSQGGNALRPQLFARRVRLELGGELMRRWSFMMGVDFGGQPLANSTGTGVSASPRPGEDPTLEAPPWAPVQAASPAAVLANNWINYRALPVLNLMLGQFLAPYSLENMTTSNDTLMLERVMPIRSFVIPNNREIGLMAWGELPNRLASYYLGVFSGEGPNRPGVDSLPAYIGRITARPFAMKKGSPLERAQIGVSALHAEHDQGFVGSDYPRISTGQFVTLWEPRYQDAQGGFVHVIPSGAQNAIGGELWLPIRDFDLRAEAHYVVHNTRESPAGFQLNNTERLGQVRGLGWYAALSFWLGDAYVNGEPGLGSRPVQLNLAEDTPVRKGVQLAAVIGGVHASYDGASRGGPYDARTPGAPGGPGTDITVMQYGAAVNYWYTRHLRLTLNYNAYQTPGSGTAENLARVPGNNLVEPIPDAHFIHELGGRVGVQF
ncbi:MAG TPA: porin, partial [Candidatus Nanopelagicales bacterium]|nr:porin [Candidatus Nanopelagicales bacterium]